MGGGTILLPILTIFFGVEQHIAQSTNLIVFLPMAVFSVIIYLKKNMIDKKLWWVLSLPACLVVGFATFFSLRISSKILKILFGIFLCFVAICQILLATKNNEKRQ